MYDIITSLCDCFSLNQIVRSLETRNFSVPDIVFSVMGWELWSSLDGYWMTHKLKHLGTILNHHGDSILEFITDCTCLMFFLLIQNLSNF